MKCQQCKTREGVGAVIDSVYYSSICKTCITEKSSSTLSSGVASFDRRRQYEDNAQDTVQPYDASGAPRPEFYRLYPTQAEKVFTKDEIEKVKRMI